MIISTGRNYIFVHIPKTGGTALSTALETRAMKDDILIGDTPKAKRRKARLKALSPSGRLWKHSTLSDIDGIVPAAVISQMEVFTVVRNPWDRMVSYYHWLREQNFDHPAVQLAKQVDFCGFLNDGATQKSIQQNPYSSYVTAVDGKEYCTQYLRSERLQADAVVLAERLGLRLPDIDRINTSVRQPDWRGYYSDDDAAIVSRICSADIAKFDYSF